MRHEGRLGRILWGTGIWATLVIALSVPLGALLFPEGWERARRQAREGFDRLRSPAEAEHEAEIDSGSGSPEPAPTRASELGEPTATKPDTARTALGPDAAFDEPLPVMSEPSGTRPAPPQTPPEIFEFRRPAETPPSMPGDRRTEVATVRGTSGVDRSLGADPGATDGLASDSTLDDTDWPPLPAELPWGEVTATAAAVGSLDRDRVVRELTDEEEQHVRQSYRTALDNLRQARAPK